MSPTEPSTNPVIAKPGESSFLIPIPPHIIPTTEVASGTYHKITNGVGKNEIKEVAIPIIPKIKATIPSALPIFISPLISFFTFLIIIHLVISLSSYKYFYKIPYEVQI